MPRSREFVSCGSKEGGTDELSRAEDTLEAELMRELENGRLVRLLTKFGFINERPE